MIRQLLKLFKRKVNASWLEDTSHVHNRRLLAIIEGAEVTGGKWQTTVIVYGCDHCRHAELGANGNLLSERYIHQLTHELAESGWRLDHEHHYGTEDGQNSAERAEPQNSTLQTDSARLT